MNEFPFHADFKRSAKNVQESFKLWWCSCIDYLKLAINAFIRHTDVDS